MLVPFLIMLREGVEASLIVGIVASYLRQTGRREWLRSVWIGVLAAAALCLAIGAALDAAEAEFPQRQQELFEGVVGLIAVVILSSMVLWMQQAARSMKATLHRSIEQAIGGGGGAANGQGVALVAMVFFAVGREGLESVFFLLATFEQNVGIAAPIGAVLGLLCAIGIGVGIYAGGIRLDLRRFFRWTGIFIVFVAAGLLAGALRAFHEAGLWNGLQGTAFDISGILPMDGAAGTVLAGILGYQDTPTIGEVVVYLAYLLPALVLLLRPAIRLGRGRRAIQAAMLGLLVGAAWLSGAAAVDVTVTRQGCQPGALHVAAGRTLFRIHNASARAMEWEILDGVMVVEERENIAPGFVSKLTATLPAGSYAMTCGLLSNPKGSLVVSPAMDTRPAAPVAAPPGAALAAPVAAYKSYVEDETAKLVDRTRALRAALQAGNLAQARAEYAPAHVHYERIEPVAELFSDLDRSMDSRADDYELKEADPAFFGFHRIELALFRAGSTEGTGPVADRLLADTLALQARLRGLAIPPGKMVGGAAELIEEVAATKITGEEDRYSRTDLWDFQSNIDGSDKIVSLVRPLLVRADPALDGEIASNFAKVDLLLSRYRTADGFKSYDTLTPDDRRALKGPVTLLAEDLSKLRGELGLQ